ncbi:MAG TPA: hypothetical protein VGO67_25560 [Verrucomicrobiae bacterium]|jgi:hypothetical protein
MHSNVFLGRSGFKRIALSSFCLSGLILCEATIGTVHAAEILATAQISGVQIARNNWAYTLTLENTAASTSDIGMLWFGWQAGAADFLKSEPTSIQTPAGWVPVLEGDAYDGFSLEFIASGPLLAPGSKVTFTFNSADSTNVMGGPAASFPQALTLTSQVYSSRTTSGNQELFLVQLVPAPSTNGLGQVTAHANGNDLNLTWTSGANVVLQQSSGLAPKNWVTVPGTLGTNAFTVTNASSAGAIFYRLATQ